eukprot:1161479-Pelagomonas_calceolata.AAC.10
MNLQITGRSIETQQWTPDPQGAEQNATSCKWTHQAKAQGLAAACGGNADEVPARLDDGPALGLNGRGAGKLSGGVQHVGREACVGKLGQGLEGAGVFSTHALHDGLTLLAQLANLCRAPGRMTWAQGKSDPINCSEVPDPYSKCGRAGTGLAWVQAAHT